MFIFYFTMLLYRPTCYNKFWVGVNYNSWQHTPWNGYSKIRQALVNNHEWN